MVKKSNQQRNIKMAKNKNRNFGTMKAQPEEGPFYAAVFEDGRPAYCVFKATENGQLTTNSKGVPLNIAIGQARGLAVPAGVSQIGGDGTLYFGTVTFADGQPPEFYSSLIPEITEEVEPA